MPGDLLESLLWPKNVWTVGVNWRNLEKTFKDMQRTCTLVFTGIIKKKTVQVMQMSKWSDFALNYLLIYKCCMQQYKIEVRVLEDPIWSPAANSLAYIYSGTHSSFNEGQQVSTNYMDGDQDKFFWNSIKSTLFPPLSCCLLIVLKTQTCQMGR